MLKKTITYTDYKGVEKTKDFYFNLSKAEMLEMEMTYEGGLTAMLNRIINAKEQTTIAKVFKDFICKSYGVISDDGDRFVKSSELTEAFLQTEAFSQLYVELSTSDEAAALFTKALIPADVAKDIMDQPAQPALPNA